jgi:D-alanine-D-alanine ligase
MKITILTYVEEEGGKKFDAVVPQVAAALRAKGHTVSTLGVHRDVKKLLAGLARREQDLVFNLVEEFGDARSGPVGVAALLDLLQIPYTGGGPGELYLQQDKGFAKKLLAYSNLSFPDFAVFSLDAGLETGGNLHMPLFVKPLRMEASIGIDGKALVRNATELMERVRFIHEKVQDAALAEEYIEGREFYIGVLGNDEPQAFPPIEMDFSGLPEGAPRVLDSKAKWSKNSAEYKGTRPVLAELPDELRAKLQKAALEAYRALRVRDYGRVDLRLSETGEIFVLEVNASCYLEKSGEFATAAAAADLDYDSLIDRIAKLALERFKKQS